MSRLRGCTPTIVAKVDTLTRVLAGAAREGRAVDMQDWCLRLTLDVISVAMLGGYDLGALEGSWEGDALRCSLPIMLELAVLRAWQPWRRLNPWCKDNALRQHHRNVFRRVLSHILAEYEAKGPEHREKDDSMLGTLLKMRNPATGRGLHRDDVLLQLGGMYIAGHDTTGNTLAWTIHLLAEHPDAQEALQREVDEAFGGEDAPAPEELNAKLSGLKFLHGVLQEAMRLFPVAAGGPSREAREDLVVSGFCIPKGSDVGIPLYAAFRDESQGWERPEAFLPSRWLQEDVPGSRGFVPFSVGKRSCIGQSLAILEAKAVLALLALRFSFKTAEPPRPQMGLTLGSANGVRVTVARRTSHGRFSPPSGQRKRQEGERPRQQD